MLNCQKFCYVSGTAKMCMMNHRICRLSLSAWQVVTRPARSCRWFRTSCSKGASLEGNSAKDVRQKFIDYFRTCQKHTFVPSSSVLPPEGSGLLFTNAGMNQFKDIIQGTVDPTSRQSTYKRVVNSQKCIRAGGKHNDLEDVGKDSYHHTFFEMLGNWSFGDYFKVEACSMAWDLLTNVYKLPRDQLYFTYFAGDEKLELHPDTESRDIWLSLGIPSQRILPFGMKDNFWEMGAVGPCGPCSEIHFNRSDIKEAAHLVNKDHPDVLEIWNLVFMEHFREPSGILAPLPSKHVDTGLGLERLVSVLQGVKSNYETDLFLPLMDAIHRYSGARPYSGLLGPSDTDLIDTAYRVIADHVRMLSVAIADGGQPDYYKRGYILKRVIRRAVRFAVEKLQSPPGLLSNLVPVVVDSLGSTYPELMKNREEICSIIDKEEKQFLKSLKKGEKYLLKTFRKLGPDRVLPGELAWKMYDGYGFPIDLTTLIAEEHGVKIDMQAFEETRKLKHEITSKGGIKNREQTLKFALKNEEISLLRKEGIAPTDDVYKFSYSSKSADTYEFQDLKAKVCAVKTENSGMVQEVAAGEQCAIILDCTNFYAEQGGQEWDEGVFLSPDQKEVLFNVEDVQSSAGYILHIGETDQPVSTGMEVELHIDKERRLNIMKNHTATHLLNFVLREIFPSAEQRGSLVAPDKFRFDFNAKRALLREELSQVMKKCNDLIGTSQQVYQSSLPLNYAKSIPGVRAMFQESGRDPVSLISIGVNTTGEGLPQPVDGYCSSVEFCGGTHVTNTSHIVKMKIVSQRLASGGIRRLTAVTGDAAALAEEKAVSLQKEAASCRCRVSDILETGSCDQQSLNSLHKDLISLSDDINDTVLDINQKEDLKTDVTDLREKLRKYQKKLKKAEMRKIVDNIATDENFTSLSRVVRHLPDGFEPKDLKDIGMQCQKRGMKSSLMLLSQKGRMMYCFCVTSEEMRGSGLSACSWAQEAASVFDGRWEGNDITGKATGTAVNKTIAECIERLKNFNT